MTKPTKAMIGYRPAADNGPVVFVGNVVGKHKPTPDDQRSILEPEAPDIVTDSLYHDTNEWRQPPPPILEDE